MSSSTQTSAKSGTKAPRKSIKDKENKPPKANAKSPAPKVVAKRKLSVDTAPENPAPVKFPVVLNTKLTKPEPVKAKKPLIPYIDH